MEIVIESPIFFAPQDEDQFFEWIYALPEYEKVAGSGTQLTICLRDPVNDDTVKQLLILCRRWCIDIAPLATLRRPSNDSFTLWDIGLAEASSWK